MVEKKVGKSIKEWRKHVSKLEELKKENHILSISEKNA